MIETVIDRKRGCGYRKPGGLYLIARKPSEPCCKLPKELEVCPCCGGGIKPARGWTWFNPMPFLQEACTDSLRGPFCPLQGSNIPERAGLIWVGSKFYRTPADYLKESQDQGISRRIPSLPRDFEVGETWVFLAHRDIQKPCPDCNGMLPCETCDNERIVTYPGIFYAFKPERVEYVVKEDDDEKKLERLEKRGITPVKVEITDDLFDDSVDE